MTADDIFYVYQGGDVVLTGDEWEDAHTVRLDNVCVLAIKANNTEGGAAMAASTSSGVVTDATWKCSSDEHTDWDEPGFDDSAWSQALVIAANDGSDYSFVDGINPEAKWIWAQDTSADIVYCRKSLC